MKFRVMMLSLLTVGLAWICNAGALGTTFTYQGVLSDGGTPVAGDVDLRFSLWDAATGGAQVGTVINVEGYAVSDGRVTVPLNFGDVFVGSELWLVVEVRDSGSGGSYTVLTPRQPLTAAPFAAHALDAETAGTAASAGHATTAGDTDTLDGQHGAYYLSWSNLSGKPAGLDDGDDDALGDLSCDPGEVAAWNGAAWGCADDRGVTFSRTVVVGPVGDAAANGTALLAAVAALPTPASSADGWLVRLEPGDYDLGTARLELDDWIHLRGSGELATRVRTARCNPAGEVVTLAQSHLSDLTIENTSSTAGCHAMGVQLSASSEGGVVERVTVNLSGTNERNIGIYVEADRAWIQTTKVYLENANLASGIFVYGARGVLLVDNLVEAESVTSGSGLTVNNDGSAVVSRGAYSGTSKGASITGGDLDASDANFNGESAAIYHYALGGNYRGDYSRIVAHGQVQLGSDATHDLEVRIEHSRVSTSDETIFILTPGDDVRVTATELDGLPVSGSLTCIAVWDEGSTFYPTTCP
jgi:hypothetical protein